MSAPPPPNPTPPIPVRLASITVSDFRAFPGGPPFVFDLGKQGKNLLLHGENGAGKSSLFHALRLLFSPRVPALPFGAYTNVFLPAPPASPGTVAVNLTAGPTPDYLWNAGTPHPAASGSDPVFRDIARRAVFLDYKELLKTSLPHEDQQTVDLFALVVESLLREVEFPDGRSVAQAWEDLRTFQPPQPPERDDDPGLDDDPDEWPSDAEHWEAANEDFWNLFSAFLARIVPRANEYLAEHLQPNLAIELTPASSDQDGVGPRRGLFLTAVYAGRPIAHPALFLNEARLSAIALALYLAAATETKPPAYASAATGERFLLPRLLVLDDPLLGLDLAHRSTLSALLRRKEWADWQIFIFTYDLGWYELAGDALEAGPLDDGKKNWVKSRLHARQHQAGWEMPVLMSDAPFLDRAKDYLQDGDYKAAGVYLRVGFESMLRDLCIERVQQVPLKKNLRDYKSEDLWPVVARYVTKGVGPLVDEGLKAEINLQRRYVLNPLCHNDPARPTREEVRRAHAALSRLEVLIAQDIAWPEQLNAELQEAAKAIVADDTPRLERALMGFMHPREFALLIACRLLARPGPPMVESALLLRSAFDRMLWRYCDKKKSTFIMRCDAQLLTNDLWAEAKLGADGLATTQAAFVAAVESQQDLLLLPDPTPDVCRSKAPADLEGLCQLFAGTNWRTDPNPKATMDHF